MTITRTERGWPGHFVGARSCLFRRNTLLQKNDLNIVVSTVGNMYDNNGELKTLGVNRIFETMIFIGEQRGKYIDANVSEEINLDMTWGISPYDKREGIDNVANDMHEKHVGEIIRLMETGEIVNFLPKDETEIEEEDEELF